MLDALEGLVAQLREVGLPISVSEVIDAVRTLEHLRLAERSEVKVGLRAALVKNAEHEHAFDTVFDLFFVLSPVPGESRYGPTVFEDADQRGAGPGDGAGNGDGTDASAGPGEGEGDGAGNGEDGTGGGRGGWGGSGLGGLDDSGVRDALVGALRSGDRQLTRAIAGLMVNRHANVEPGRPVAGTYYLIRTLRAINPELLQAALIVTGDQETAGDPLAARLLAERSAAQIQAFRHEVSAEIRRRLVADRGAVAVARTLRTPLPEDIGFLTASQAEIASLRTVIEPLTRKLATRLARRRRHRRQGALDFRRTVRASMSTGGVPAEPMFRKPRPSKPELVVLADISGSVATFAGFTLHFVYALRQQFAKVRCFVFVDGVDEVTDIIAESRDIVEATARINRESRGVRLDGRSNYGHALESFWEGWGRQISSRSTVVVLGDARTNYHPPHDHVLAAIRKRAARLFWLNPETATAWGTGDSVIASYAPHCDAVFECRNLRQLKAFVEQLD